MTETVAFLIAGLLAAVLKAYFSADQVTLSRKSVADVIIGGAVGLLYPLFPVVPLPAGASLIQRAAIVLVICYVSTDLLQNILGKVGVKIPGGDTLKSWLPWIAVPLLGLTLASCAIGLVASGTAIKGVGQDWLAANVALVDACKPSAPRLDVATCNQARAFGEKFKQAYPLAAQLYQTAVNANDTSMAGNATAVIRQLAVDGSALAIKVGLTIREVK